MKKVIVLSTAAIAALISMNASALEIMARVVSSTPVLQQVAVPHQVCNNEAVVVQSQQSGTGALLGAVAGGAAGNAIGNGGGRAVATMLGLFGGAILGNNIEGSNNQVQNVQRCGTQTSYENRTSHFNVVYEYQGAQYNVQMPQDPGQYVRLQVTPVGGMNSGPQTYSQPTSPVYVTPAQPVYVQPSVTYIQEAPVVYRAPVYYQRQSYVSPYYASPVGVSVNLGFGSGYRGGYGGHGGYGAYSGHGGYGGDRHWR